jgi:hypothetical protein
VHDRDDRESREHDTDDCAFKFHHFSGFYCGTTDQLLIAASTLN